MPEILQNIDWTNIGMLFATIVLAFLTGAYVSLTRRLVRAQVEPNVIVYVHHDNTRPTILQIVIHNIGTATARDIKFELSGQIPSRAFGLDPKTSKETDVMIEGPLIEGIPALPPGEDRRIDWGQYGGLTKALGDSHINVKAKYTTEANKTRETNSVLEIRSFLGTNASEYDPYKEIVGHLGKIQGNLGTISNSLSAIQLMMAKDQKEDQN